MSEDSMSKVQDFLKVVETLFGADGCPWVKELQLSLLQRSLLEETHEVIASIAVQDWDELADELGDLLFNVMCIAKVMEREGVFSWQEPFVRAARKQTRRSPHVFLPGRKLQTRKEVEIQWQEIKKEEKKLKKTDESELEKAVKIFPATTLLEKILDTVGHDEKSRKVLEDRLHTPAPSEKEQMARDFLKIALKAYDYDCSLESLIKKELTSCIASLDHKETPCSSTKGVSV